MSDRCPFNDPEYDGPDVGQADPCPTCGAMEAGDHAPCVWKGDPDEIMHTRAELASVRDQLARTEAERDELRLAILGGEDVPGVAATVSIADTIKALRESEANWRSYGESAEARLSDTERRLKEEVEASEDLRSLTDDLVSWVEVHELSAAQKGWTEIRKAYAHVAAELRCRAAALVTAEKERERG